MGNASIIISLKEQSIPLYSFQNSVEIMHRKTLEADIECMILVDDGLGVILMFS